MISLIDLFLQEFRVSSTSKSKQIPGEYIKVCMTTSVWEIIKEARSISISLIDAKKLITLLCEKIGHQKVPNVDLTRANHSFYKPINYTIYFNKSMPTVGTVLHELAHVLAPVEVTEKERYYTEREIERLYGYIPDDYNKEDFIKKTYRRDVHSATFIKKLDELAILWKKLVCGDEI
jgi:hypothetical protein